MFVSRNFKDILKIVGIFTIEYYKTVGWTIKYTWAIFVTFKTIGCNIVRIRLG